MKRRTIKLKMTESNFRLVMVALSKLMDHCKDSKMGDPVIIDEFRRELFAQVYPALVAIVQEPSIPSEL